MYDSGHYYLMSQSNPNPEKIGANGDHRFAGGGLSGRPFRLTKNDLANVLWIQSTILGRKLDKVVNKKKFDCLIRKARQI